MNLKIAWRNLKKRAIQNLINIIGLICGITFFMITMAYIWSAYQVNNEIRIKDQQFLLQSTYREDGQGLPLTTIGALPKALHEEYPQLVSNYFRIDGISCIISNQDQIFEENVTVGDPTIFDMFGFHLTYGDSKTALTKPYSVVITESAAEKYFHRLDVIGEKLTVRNFNGEKHDFQVTGVISNFGRNSVMELTPSLEADIFLPIINEEFFGRSIDNWQNIYIAGFIELQNGVHPEQLTEPIRTLVNKNMDKSFSESYAPAIKPLKSYYLDDNDGAIRKMIGILLALSGFILSMAIINFVNFSITQHIDRLKEIGVRKIMGANKGQIAKQILVEFMLLTFIAALLCIPFYAICKPLFDQMLMTSLPTLMELPLYFYGLLLLSAFIIGLLSGIYPAMKLSTNKILDSVKLQLNDVSTKHFVRKTLLYLQFTVAVLILISTVVISKQIQLFIKGDLGYQKEYLMTVKVPRNWSAEGVRQMETIRQSLLENSHIDHISLSFDIPNRINSQSGALTNIQDQRMINAQAIISDSHFAETYQIPLLAGRFFNHSSPDTSQIKEIVLNAEAAKQIGFQTPSEAVGQTIPIFEGTEKAVITGVTDNFVANSMHEPTTALFWINVSQETAFRYFSIRLKPGSVSTTIQDIHEKWKKLLPEAPFEYEFMEDKVHEIYKTELRLERATYIASFISLLIILMGVSGLMTLSITARFKEVSMRKILGASNHNLMLIFSKEFYLIFLLAILTAAPLSFILMKKWLQNFSQQINLDVFTYLTPIITLVATISLVMFIVVYRNTRFNPIDKLRDE